MQPARIASYSAASTLAPLSLAPALITSFCPCLWFLLFCHIWPSPKFSLLLSVCLSAFLSILEGPVSVFTLKHLGYRGNRINDVDFFSITMTLQLACPVTPINFETWIRFTNAMKSTVFPLLPNDIWSETECHVLSQWRLGRWIWCHSSHPLTPSTLGSPRMHSTAHWKGFPNCLPHPYFIGSNAESKKDSNQAV